MLKMRKYFRVAVTSLQSNMAYASDFFAGTVFFALLIYVFLHLWKLVYGGKSDLGGYTLQQVIWYCVVTEIIVLSGSNIFNDISSEIKEGSIAYLLNRPYHYLLYQLSNGAGLMAVKLAVNTLMGLVIGFVFVGGLKTFDPLALPFILLSAVLGILLNFFIYMSIGMTAFWLEENMAFFWILQKLSFMLGVLLPLEFLPRWLGNIARLTPFPYISYAPAKLTVDFSLERAAELLLMQSGYLLFILLIAFGIYSKGVKMLNVNGG